MKYYQLTYLLPGDLNKEEAKKEAEKINSSIQKENKVVIVDSEKPSKRNLAYPVKDYKIAHLAETTLYAARDYLETLKKKLKETENILRFILKKTEPKKKTVSKKVKKKVPSKKAKKEKEQEEQEKEKLEEIDQKLDEILGK